MFLYGVAYGSLTSGILFMALIADIPDLTYSGLAGAFIFGFPFGLLVGGFAGIFCGLAMMILIDVFLPCELTVDVVRTSRLSTGTTTALLSGGIFTLPFGGGLLTFSSFVQNHVVVLGFFISIVIAIIASQQTLTKYLREIDPRKQKVKN